MNKKSMRLKRFIRTAQFLLLDAFSIVVTYAITIFMFILVDIEIHMNLVFMVLPVIVLIKLLFYYIFGLYHMILDHVGFEDVFRIAAVAIVSNTVLFFIFSFVDVEFVHPLAFVLIAPLEIGFIALPRMLKRVIYFIQNNIVWRDGKGKRTIIIGAGDGGELVLKEIYRNRALDNIPVAFVDDDHEKIGSKLLGISVVGPIERIQFFIDQYSADEVIIAIANLKLKRLQNLVELIAEKDVTIKRLPLMSEITDDMPHKVMDVKVEDLLNRDEITLDNEGIQDFIKNETVLITGGGGSIGSELCRQVATFNPKQLIVFDIYENNAYEIQMELIRTYAKTKQPLNLKVLIGSVYNEECLEEVFQEYQPTIVFHAAAYKHVPLMEDSPKEAVRTNVLGTYYAAKLSKQYHVKNFVLVSSDKAVRPTNIMGATKRYAELIIQSFNDENSGTKYSSVRFGNVLGSNGSVIPLFKKQIEDGGPVTVTHPEITRYFMTIPESVSLILQCAVYSQGGEIFILDMGEPVKILDLAEKMIKLAGYKPKRDIDIKFTGLRPGEKLYEELLVDVHQNNTETANEKIFIEINCDNGDHINIDNIVNMFDETTTLNIKREIAASIKSYKLSS